MSDIPGALALLADLWPLFAFLASVVFSGTMLFLNSRFVPRKDCTTVRESAEGQRREMARLLDEAESRLQALEAARMYTPTRKEVEALLISMERLSGRLDTHEAVVDGLRELVHRMEAQSNRMDGYLRELHK
jgi:hypothetical protein